MEDEILKKRQTELERQKKKSWRHIKEDKRQFGHNRMFWEVGMKGWERKHWRNMVFELHETIEL